MAFLQETSIWIPNWQWLVLALSFFLWLVVKPVLEKIVLRIRRSAEKIHKGRNEHFWYFLSQQPIEKSISVILLCSIQLMLLDSMNLPDKADKYLSMLVKGVGAYFIIRLVYMAVDALGKNLTYWLHQKESSVDTQMATFVTKSIKVLVIVLGILIIVQNFGVNVVSLLAGLGLGGLALALAAQDTAANVFGSITILMDRPFKIGDVIKIGDTEGTVEEIGFRSTRIRTFYNSLITIPNSVVAKEKIDNMGLRPFRRIQHNLGIEYGSTPEQIHSFCEHVRDFILKTPHVKTDSVLVHFNAYADSSLNILVNFHIEVFSIEEELFLQQKVLLQIMQVAKQVGVDFAFPTRTVFHKNS